MAACCLQKKIDNVVLVFLMFQWRNFGSCSLCWFMWIAWVSYEWLLLLANLLQLFICFLLLQFISFLQDGQQRRINKTMFCMHGLSIPFLQLCYTFINCRPKKGKCFVGVQVLDLWSSFSVDFLCHGEGSGGEKISKTMPFLSVPNSWESSRAWCSI